ncbi:phage tail tape measure protein [Ornithinimicrobium sufpigmenti]|uniref:phage tail tape measure protein n=1 Tax=Ornithinimicrobium sufpigmenti TaxID=2508882 RepID=UPI0010367905|nr:MULTISPECIES: phage tail tape measure protein [unclassified Ornithinimicrobium]
MSFDLGTIHGGIDFDITEFDRKYALVDQMLDQLGARQAPMLKIDVDTAPAESAVDTFVGSLEGVQDATVDLDVDTVRAEASLDAVEGELEDLARREYDPQVDVDIERAEKKITDHKRELEVLSRMEPTTQVQADVAKAEKNLASAESRLKALQGMRAEMEVLADTGQAEGAIDVVVDKADAAGDDAGGRMGDGMVMGILAGLASIPIAGAVIKIGQAIGTGLLDGIRDGLNVELQRDLFSARTGLDEATAARFARAAGNAYADAFGESIEANLDTARNALQIGLIDVDATTAEIQQIIGQLDSLATISEEDSARVAQAVDVMLSAGIVKSADEALDVLTRGFQTGTNAAEDLLDTFIEYPALMERLGLDAETALGMLNQGLEGGARNADLVADALKEFQIRATDASEASADGFEAIGLNAEKMTAKIARGGEGAAEGLQQVLDGLRDMEDPVERNAAGVALFGTQWEDLGSAILNLDPSKAVTDLGQVEGALDSAMTALADNPATAVESAQRQIELAADGIKGALAMAFSDPLEDFASWVSGNRAGVMEFFGGVANMAFEAGAAVVEFAASGLEAFGDFIEFGIVQAILSMDHLIEVANELGLIDVEEGFVDGLVGGLRDIRWEAYQAADGMREGLIENGIDPAQEAFNSFLEDEIVSARVHDLTNAMVGDIEGVGAAVEDLNGLALDDLSGQFDTGTEKGALLHEQLQTAVGSMYDAQNAAIAAGEGQDALNGRWGTAYGLLVDQLRQMGYTKDEAYRLAEAYGAVPDFVDTQVRLATRDAYATLQGFLNSIPSSVSVALRAAPGPIGAFGSILGAFGRADGGAIEMADGGAVTGPGGPRDDLIPAINTDTGQAYRLSNGEHVLDADDVLDLGGQAGAYQLRAMIQAGMVKPLEQGVGTAVAGGRQVTVNVTNIHPISEPESVHTERALTQVGALNL